MQHAKTILITGFALFAMFFGAGNIVFPLTLGVSSGQYLPLSMAAFLLTGVAMPYFGLYALSLYEGDYWKFFRALGRPLAFCVITFILLVIGPLFAAPRTAVVTFHTFLPFLPSAMQTPWIFNALYFALVFTLIARPSQVIQVIGKYISPIKISAFVLLIIVALLGAKTVFTTDQAPTQIMMNSLSLGYGTMDLLGAFFYCSVAYLYVKKQCKLHGVEKSEEVHKVMSTACWVGASLTCLIYVGFMLSAHAHAAQLQGVATENMVSSLSMLILGKLSAFFVCIFVFFASIATATALAEVSANYFHHYLFRGAVSRNASLVMVLVTMYGMSILGFDMIMRLAIPVLNVLYPALVAYTALVLIANKTSVGQWLTRFQPPQGVTKAE